MTETLSKSVTFGYSIGHLLNDLCSALWFTYSLIFYNKVIEFSNMYAGAIMLIGQVADAIATPAIGIWSDTYTIFYLGAVGKRKSWYCLGTFMVVISLPFIYSNPIFGHNSNKNLQLVYYSIFVIIFQFGWAAVQTVHLALVADLTLVSTERTTLISLRNTFTVVSNITVYVIAAIAFGTCSGLSPTKILPFTIITACVLVIGGIASVVFFILVKEGKHQLLLDEQRDGVPAVNQITTHFSWLKKGRIYHVALVYMFTRIYCNVVQSLMPFYIYKSLKLPAYELAVVPLVMYITSFVTSLLCGLFSGYMNKKVAYVIGGVLGIGACIWIEVQYDNVFKKYLIYVVAALLGVGNPVMLIVAVAVTSDLIGSDTRNSAFIYGLMSFVDKLSCGIVIMLIQSLAPDKDEMYYIHALSLTCGLSAALGGITTCLLPTSLIQNQVFVDNIPPDPHGEGLMNPEKEK